MDKIIKKAMSKSLTDDDLKRYKKVPVLLYRELAKYKDIKDIGKCFILLYPGKTDPCNGHWTAIINRGGVIEHFDPYAYSVDDELNFSNLKYPKLLTELLLRSKGIRRVECNKLPLQERKKGINTCGRWALIRCMMADMPLSKFTELFKRQPMSPDMWVTAITLFI